MTCCPSSIFAIDPGPQKSAYCLFDATERVPLAVAVAYCKREECHG